MGWIQPTPPLDLAYRASNPAIAAATAASSCCLAKRPGWPGEVPVAESEALACLELS